MKLYCIIALSLLLRPETATAQQEESITLSLQQAIEIAQENSPEAQAARHTYRAAYWNYRFFRANYLPSVTLTSSPTLNREINKITQPDGTNQFIQQDQLSTDLSLKINQNIWFTGGSLFVKTTTQRIDEFEDNHTAYNTQPIVIGYEQQLFGYNSLKWDHRIEPLRYREARKAYAEALELVASETSTLFFNLAGLKADLYVQFGLSQTGNKFADSYRNPMNQQYASIGISLPILDWGRGKGRVRVARSNVDLVDTQAEQGMKDFELNVCKMVRQFNLQAYRVAVAAKTDKTADRRHDVARRLYILGKSTILDLNAAIAEKDTARRNYITALKTYWSLYYGIRSMTGYDFLRKAEISCTIPKP